MNDKYPTKAAHDPEESEIPVLTEVIDAPDTDELASMPSAAQDVPLAVALESARLSQMEAELSARLSSELALQIPVLLEAALREHLPKAIGAKLQAELLSSLANALPGLAQNAAAELSSTLAFEVGGLLEQRVEDEVRRAVADQIAQLSGAPQPPR